MFKAMFLAGNVIALLLSPFSIHPAVTVSGISNITADQVTNFIDIDVEYSSGSETISGTLNAHDVWLLSSGTYLRCTNWDSTAGACKVYQLSASPSSASNVHINEAAQTYTEDGTITYTNLKVWYTQEDVIKIAFNDGKKHTGSMTISPSAAYYGFQSDDPNVQVIGTTIYFFDVGAFDVYHRIPQRLKGNWNTTSFNYTLSDLQEYPASSMSDLIRYAQLIYKTADSNEIGAYMYWQTLGGLLQEDNDLYFHHNFKMTNYSDDQKYTVGKNLLVRAGEPMYISFYSTMYLGSSARRPVVYSSSNVTPTIDMIQYSEVRGLYYYTFKLSIPDGTSPTLCDVEYNMSSSTTVIPVYVGSGIGLSQDQKSAYGIDNDQSSKEINTNDSITNTLNSAASQEQTITAAQESQFNDAIGQINTSNPIAGLTDLANSATWVRNRFNELTTSTAFGTVLGFSLLLGLALAIVGRIM